MRFTATINMDGAPFEDPEELATVLDKISRQVQAGHTEGAAMTSWGQSCGLWKIRGKRPKGDS